MTFNAQLGERLKQERERLGFSQQEFADRIGVRREMWSKYERGQSVPGGEALASFASIGGDVLFALLGASGVTALTTDEKQLLADYRKLDVRGKAGVLAMVSGLNVSEEAATKAVFHGDVGQVVQGNQTAPVKIKVGRKKDKKE